MQVFTSYFARINRLPKDTQPVSIARYMPKDVKIPSIPELAPTPDILFEYKKCPDEKRYTARYKAEVLAKLDPNDIIAKLESYRKNTVALCCYERSGAFCHRNIVMEWLRPALEAHGHIAAGEYTFK